MPRCLLLTQSGPRRLRIAAALGPTRSGAQRKRLYRSPFKLPLGCVLTARVRINAIIALSVRPSACAISRSLRSTSGATTLRTITTRSVRGESAGNVRAIDFEAPLPLPLSSMVLIIATPAITKAKTPRRTIISRFTRVRTKSRTRKHTEYDFALAYLHGTYPRSCQLMFTPALVASGIGDEILFVGP